MSDEVKVSNKDLQEAEKAVSYKREEELARIIEEKESERKKIEELLKKAQSEGYENALKELQEQEKQKKVDDALNKAQELERKMQEEQEKLRKEFEEKLNNALPRTKQVSSADSPLNQGSEKQKIKESFSQISQDKAYEINEKSEQEWLRYVRNRK